MGKKKITAYTGEHNKWYAQAKETTTATLPEFIRHITQDYEHDYYTIFHAITAAGIAAMCAVNKANKKPIDENQANYVMWTFIYQWMYPQNKCGLAMLDYDNLLFPQMETYFEKKLPREAFERVQAQAKDLLEADDDITPTVKEHLQSIVDGKPPFGFEIMEE